MVKTIYIVVARFSPTATHKMSTVLKQYVICYGGYEKGKMSHDLNQRTWPILFSNFLNAKFQPFLSFKSLSFQNGLYIIKIL